MTTQQQHATDQAGAQAHPGSTGPGAAGNARTHGLTASKCFSEAEKAMIDVRLAAFESELHPEGTQQHDEVRAIAMASVRLERCLVEEEACRLRRAERAEFFWDADMWADVMKQVQGLPKRPELIASKLRQSLRGCMWLRKEWRDLACRVSLTPTGGSPRPLDDTGRRRAGDLLGLSLECRFGPSPLDLPGGAGSEAELAEHQATVIATQIAELEPLTNEQRVALDESIRIDTMNGTNLTVDGPTRLVRRYETEARRVKDRAYQKLQELKDTAAKLKQEAQERARQKWMDTVLLARPISQAPIDKARAQAAPEPDPELEPQPEAPGVLDEAVQVSPAGPDVDTFAALGDGFRLSVEPAAPALPPVTPPRHLTGRARKELAARAARAAKAAHRTPR